MEDTAPKKRRKALGAGGIWIAALVFAALLGVMVFFVIRFDAEGSGPEHPDSSPSPTGEAALPTDSPGPDVSPEAPTPGPTGLPITINKTAVRIGPDFAIVLASRQAAEELIRNVERHFLSLGSMPDNAVIELRTPMTIENAGKDDETVPYDEAFAFLTGLDTPLLFSARAATVIDVVIPHTVSVITDEDLPVGFRIVEVSGRDGLVREYHETHYLNGVIQSDDVTETHVIFNAVESVIREGAMEIDEDFELTPDFGKDPVEAHAFVFSAPITGEILKYFGPCDGSFHQGIDIAAANGAEIRAACGGTVAAVMDRGAYGLMIEIDHGSGVCTRYARLRNTTVKLGDEVKAGDVIGKIAGDEYSSFLHFELRIGGIAYNPLKILTGFDTGRRE